MNDRQDRSLLLPFLLTITAYFALHIVLRIWISPSLDYDEAEQALLGQWLLAGYTEQPPLYSWVQHLLFRWLGDGVLAVSLLKNSLLFSTYLLVFLAGRQLFDDDRRSVLAALSLLMIPQIGWESQRDMTHTTLVVAAAAATLLFTLRLINRQRTRDYLLLGLALAVGVLGKANFGILVAVLFLTLLSSAEGRRLLFDRRILLALAICLLVNSRYLMWMMANQDIVFSATHKFKRAVELYYLKGSVSLFTNSLLFLTPLLFFWLFLFPGGYIERDVDNGASRFMHRYLLFLYVVLLLVVLLFKVSYVKDRWLQPLLFAMPLLFFCRVPAAQLTPRRVRIYLLLVLACAAGIYTAFTLRVTAASYMENFCRMNFPFSSVSEELRRDGFSGGVIVSDNRFLAGNLRLQFPGSVGLIPGYHFEELPEVHNVLINHQKSIGDTSGLAIWLAGDDQQHPMPPPADLTSMLQSSYGVDPATIASQTKTFEKEYLWGRGEKIRFSCIHFPLQLSP